MAARKKSAKKKKARESTAAKLARYDREQMARTDKWRKRVAKPIYKGEKVAEIGRQALIQQSKYEGEDFNRVVKGIMSRGNKKR